MKKLFIVILIVLVALFLLKDFIAGGFLTFGIGSFTDLSASVQKVSLGVFKSAIEVEGFKLYNPRRDFKDRVMMDMPELYIEYDLGSFLAGTKHLKKIRLDVREFTVVKNEAGNLNINYIKAVEEETGKGVRQKKEAGKEKDFKFRIDVLELKIDKVIYKDYSKAGEPIVKEFNVGIDERYTDITNPYSFVSLVVYKALYKTAIASLADFDLGTLKNAASDALVGATSLAVDTAVKATGIGGEAAKGAVSTTTETIKKLLPLGK